MDENRAPDSSPMALPRQESKLCLSDDEYKRGWRIKSVNGKAVYKFWHPEILLRSLGLWVSD